MFRIFVYTQNGSFKKAMYEGYVSALTEEGYSYSMIKKRCKVHGFPTPEVTIRKIINKKEKKSSLPGI